jgi:aspartyl-tRNA(Asn)/glutamyl-tRNA(Gln) amidotransferase subunit A
MTDTCFLTATELVQLMDAKQVSSEEVTRRFLERIELFDPLLRAFITIDADGALAQARAADSRSGSRGPLHGIPVAVKDNIATRGLRTTAGSRVLADWIPTSDAPVVRRLKEAGAVILGKTNMHEFAYGGTCTNVEFGAVRNPWNTDHMPGGSSGGSGVAVAAGLATLAVGTDTAGSVRLPACQCGIVGLKPTYGRVSIQDVIPLAWSLDHVGPMTRGVADAALLLSVLAGWEAIDPTSRQLPLTDLVRPEQGIGGLRLGIPRAYFFDGLQPDVEAAIDHALEVLRDLGAELVEVEWPGVELSNSVTWTIVMAEASAYHRQWFRDRPAEYSAETRAHLELAETLPAADYVQAQRARSVLRHNVQAVLGGVDALVTPALAITSPRVGQTTVTLGGKMKEINPVFIRLADPFNVTGLPAISVPCGFGTDGLPIGLQVAAAPFAELMVLRVARAYEQATVWHTKRPIGH